MARASFENLKLGLTRMAPNAREWRTSFENLKLGLTRMARASFENLKLGLTRMACEWRDPNGANGAGFG